MTAVLSGTNGLLQAYEYQTPATGFNYVFPAGTQVLVMNPAGTLATGTITMPASPVDGMTITFSSSQQITALTMSGNGATIVGAVTFLPAKTGVTYVYRQNNPGGTTWYPTATVPGTGSQLVSGTSQASTSGTSIDFTGIPSWVKRITVMFNQVSTSGTSNIQIQLGTGGGPTFTTSGYGNNYSALSSASVSTSSATSGFVCAAISVATAVCSGNIIITNISGNNWIESGQTGETNGTRVTSSAGIIALGAALTAVRITTVNGTDTFDAGSINILYE